MIKLCISKVKKILLLGSPTSYGDYFFRNRNKLKSHNSTGSDGISQIDESEGYQSSRSTSPSDSLSPPLTSTKRNITSTQAVMPQNGRRARARFESSCLDSAFTSVSQRL